MLVVDMNLEKLRQALSCANKQTIVAPERTPSAVLLPIYCKGGEYYLIFIKRTEKVRYHKGQISFPGGAYQKEDRTLLETALRETNEEIGIAPEHVEVLGCLNDVLAYVSGYIISPFAALVHRPGPFKLNPYEVQEVIEVPISKLLEKGCSYQETEILGGQSVPAYYYRYQDRVIWGATARILTQFLDILTRLDEN